MEKEKETKTEKKECKPEAKKEVAITDLPGVGPATIEKLETVGYLDLMSIAVATPGELDRAHAAQRAVEHHGVARPDADTARRLRHVAASDADAFVTWLGFHGSDPSPGERRDRAPLKNAGTGTDFPDRMAGAVARRRKSGGQSRFSPTAGLTGDTALG